eukprot:1092307-Amphidinium_carterae.1
MSNDSDRRLIRSLPSRTMPDQSERGLAKKTHFRSTILQHIHLLSVSSFHIPLTLQCGANVNARKTLCKRFLTPSVQVRVDGRCGLVFLLFIIDSLFQSSDMPHFSSAVLTATKCLSRQMTPNGTWFYTFKSRTEHSFSCTALAVTRNCND